MFRRYGNRGDGIFISGTADYVTIQGNSMSPPLYRTVIGGNGFATPADGGALPDLYGNGTYSTNACSRCSFRDVHSNSCCLVMNNDFDQCGKVERGSHRSGCVVLRGVDDGVMWMLIM